MFLSGSSECKWCFACLRTINIKIYFLNGISIENIQIGSLSTLREVDNKNKRTYFKVWYGFP